MTDRASRRRFHVLIWRLMNPLARQFAGVVPWWVLIETRGNLTGRQRRTPVAAGPRDASGMWLNAVHGRHSAWVRNLDAEPRLRIRFRRRWHDAVARVHPYDPALAARFNAYARLGPTLMGIDPVHVRVEWRETFGTSS